MSVVVRKATGGYPMSAEGKDSPDAVFARGAFEARARLCWRPANGNDTTLRISKRDLVREPFSWDGSNVCFLCRRIGCHMREYPLHFTNIYFFRKAQGAHDAGQDNRHRIEWLPRTPVGVENHNKRRHSPIHPYFRLTDFNIISWSDPFQPDRQEVT